MGLFDEPKPRRKTLPRHVRNTVWKQYVGAENAVGKCYVCGTPIHWSSFEVGHNKAKSKGGSDDVSNLRPICGDCNKAMGTKSIETFKTKYFGEAKKSGKRSTELMAKVQIYMFKQGYELSSKKYGFDVCAKKEGGLSDRDRYLVVGFNQEKTVTGNYISDFMKKIGKFNKMISKEYLIGSPYVEGLIAYTGVLSKGAPVLVRGFKPPVKFKKF